MLFYSKRQKYMLFQLSDLVSFTIIYKRGYKARNILECAKPCAVNYKQAKIYKGFSLYYILFRRNIKTYIWQNIINVKLSVQSDKPIFILLQTAKKVKALARFLCQILHICYVNFIEQRTIRLFWRKKYEKSSIALEICIMLCYNINV